MDKSEFLKLKEDLGKQGMVPLKIVSESMEPVLSKGSNYKVAKLEDEPSKFDIIVFLRDGSLVAHYIWRVNRLKGTSFTTRSLQDPAHDEIPVDESEVLGILVGKRLNFLRKLILNFRYA